MDRTRPFPELTHRGQLRRMRRAAERALPAWGLGGARLVTLDLVENATFRVEAGERFLLRIQLPGFKAAEEVRSEFDWLSALRRETDLTVPEAVPARDGGTVVEVGTDSDPPLVLASLLRWIPGRIHGRSAGAARHRAIGALMARLHRHALRWKPPAGFRRYDWRGRGLFGAENDFTLPPEEIRSMVPERHRGFFRAVEARTLEAMTEMDREPGAAGLVHADLHPANIVFAKGEARPIDFEDCGTAHWVYDLAVPAAFALGRPEHGELTAALVEGYESVRPFPAGQLRHLGLFQVAREVSNALWIADHSRVFAHCRDDRPRWIDRLAERARRVRAV